MPSDQQEQLLTAIYLRDHWTRQWAEIDPIANPHLYAFREGVITRMDVES